MTVRFAVPKSLASALRFDAIKRRARGRSVTDVRFDVDDRRSGHSEVRITCSMAMAIFFVEELSALTAKAEAQRDPTLLADCRRAVAATIRAIDDAERSRSVPARPIAYVPASENRV